MFSTRYFLRFLFFCFFFFTAFPLQAAIEKIDFPPFSLIERKHSMANPKKYSLGKIPKKLRERISTNSVSRVAVFQGGQSLAKEFFGIKYNFTEISDTFDDGKETSYFFSPHGGLVVDFRNYGRDAVLHKALIYHFSGIPIQKLDVYIDDHADNFNQGFYETARMAGNAEYLIIGYRKSLVRDFTLRKIAALKARNLSNIFSDEKNERIVFNCLTQCYVKKSGSSGLANFVKLLRAFSAFLKSTRPENLFRFHRDYFRLAEAEVRILRILPKKIPPELETVISPKGFQVSNPDLINGKKAGVFLKTPFDMTRFNIIKTDGTENSIFALKHPFGSTAATLARHFRAVKTRKMLFIGSAGGLSKELKHGDIVVPQAFTLIDRNLNFIPGSASNGFTELPNDDVSSRLKRVSLHASIPSPLLETEDVQRRLEKEGVSTIDCEGGHLFSIPDQGRHTGAVFLITDLPGTTTTLEEFDSNHPDLLEAQMRILDLVIGYFQIEDIRLE